MRRIKCLRPKITIFLIAFLILALLAVSPRGLRSSAAGSSSSTSSRLDLYARRVPDVNTNLLAAVTRQATPAQLAAIENFKSSYGAQASVRWNPFAGSPDVMTGFHTAPSADTPENTARAFINQNGALFGTDAASLKLISAQDGLGGHLLRFQQQANGL
ncbi:MAG TPA: hypothetical protein VEV81_10540, partial [Pyrinomonadaceae bacterium]|nr:hypothetical protein [Pyrinomonadaceae bacterium]